MKLCKKLGEGSEQNLVMKIAIDARSLDSHMGGVGQYVYHLVEELLKNGIKCMLLTSVERNIPQFKNQKNLEIVKVVGNTSISLQRYKVENLVFRRILSKYNPDLYHATDSRGIPRLNIPTVLTVHDIIPLRFIRLNILKKILYTYSIKQSLHRADGIIAISNYTKNDLHKYLKVQLNKITVVYQGCSIKVSFNKVTLPFKLPNAFLLYAGGYGPRKNICNMLKSYKKFIEKNPKGPHLILVGEMNQRKEFKKYKYLIHKLQIADKVIFSGYLSNDQLVYIRKKALFALYISLDEGFGLPIIEAMAQGVPVLTSNVTVMPEIAGGASLLADPYDIDDIFHKMNKLLNDKNLRNTLIQKGKLRAKDFSWKKTAKETLKIYKELIKNKK